MSSLVDHTLSVFITASVLLNLFFLCHRRRRTQASKSKPQLSVGNRALHTRDYFYVGGAYVHHGSSTVHHGQMYVEHLTPARVTRRFPILFIHGNGMTGTNWLNTPDGRPGWSDYFLNEGYEVKLPSTVGEKRLHDGSSRYTLSISLLGDALHGSLMWMARRAPLLHGPWSHDLLPRKSMIFGRRPPCTHSGPEVGARAIQFLTPSIALSCLVSLPQLELPSS